MPIIKGTIRAFRKYSEAHAMTSEKKDPWVIINRVTKEEVSSAPTKAAALKLTEGFNNQSVANGGEKVFAVVPRVRQ